MKRILTLALCLFITATAAAETKPAATHIILVRHAEKMAEGSDPDLSPAGKARAELLTKMLADADVAAIYSSDRKRARETAAPLAASKKIKVIEYNPSAPGANQKMAAEIVEKYRGRTVLVVGHSNTVPALIEALGLAGAPKIEETEYDNLFICTVTPDGAAHLVRLRY